jgi:hypothetical protein
LSGKSSHARAIENWSLRQDNTTQMRKPHHGDIEPGDIVVSTIEGNTDAAGSREGGGVFRKRRKLSAIRSRIRFTI